MSPHSLVCTGCGCLCDDVKVEVDGTRLGKIENACVKGVAYLHSAVNEQRRPRSLVAGQSVPLDKAIEEAARLLSKARNPVVFGLDDSTLEAQSAAIELARKLGAVIDDVSSFSYGNLIDSILSGGLPTCSLSEVKDNADLLIYWGSDAPHTHPRHISRYSYYAYSDYDVAGWYPKVTLSCVEIRDTELSAICHPAFKIRPGSDAEFIDAVLGREPDVQGQAGAFAELIEKSRFCAVFCGLGLVYSLGDDFASFGELVARFSQGRRMAVAPMVTETNLWGFNRSLKNLTGHVNRVSFASGISHGSEFSLLEQVRKGESDCLLLIGSDPFSILPQSLMKNLEGASLICLQRFCSPTTDVADVVIPTALPGWECGGSVVRMDGEEVTLTQVAKGDCPTEEEILKQLAERT